MYVVTDYFVFVDCACLCSIGLQACNVLSKGIVVGPL